MKSANKNRAVVLAALLAASAAVPVFAAGVVSEPYVPDGLAVATTVSPAAAPAAAPAPIAVAAPVAEPAPASPAPSAKKSQTSSEADAAEAIKAAKKIFGSTDEYKKVETYSSKQGDLTLFDIEWSDGGERKNMSVTMGSDGILYGYYLDQDQVNYNKIVEPSITRFEAAKKGLEFIKKVYPDISGDFSADWSDVTYSSYGRFNLEFRRVHDGYPVGEEYISMTTDADGEIYSVNNNATYALVFPEAETISDAELVSVIKSELPMKLRYESWYPDGYGRDKKAQIRLVYVPNDDYGRYFIGAADGELYTYTYDWARAGGSKNYYAADMASAAAPMPEAAEEDSGLSAAEQESVELLSSMLTAEKAAEKVLKDKELYFTQSKDGGSSLKLSHSRLYKETSTYSDAERYIWNLEFSDSDGRWSSASVNADTGELISFSSYSDQWKAASDYKLGYDDCAKIADKFIAARLPDIYGEYTLKENDYWITAEKSEEYISTYSFSYVRVVNGIEYQADRISVQIEPENGFVSQFGYSYADASFPDPKKAVTADHAADVYYRTAELQRSWIAVETGEKSDECDLIIASGAAVGKPVKAMLVTKAVSFKVDAIKSSMLQTPYDVKAEKSVYAFSDIAGNKYEDAINRLADMSIIDFKAKYEPDKAISESDLTAMINAAGRRWYYYSSEGKLRDTMTRIEALKAIVSTLGWDEIASHSEIFRLDEDAAVNLDAEDVGYMAVAKAVGMLDYIGTSYDVSRTFSRGEAAALVSAYIDYLMTKNG